MPSVARLKLCADILFEDADLVVLNKPAGMLSIPDRFDADAPNLAANLREQYGDIFVVHRLDRETSGVILFAKNADSHRALNIQFESHAARKRYDALVDGIVKEESGTIDFPIGEHPRRKGMMCVDAQDGKNATTLYTVVRRFREFTHVSVTLVTGRQHQIRVHAAAIGHPLAVDGLYGARTALLLSSIKRKYRASGEERPLMARLSLHASELTFEHPRTHEARTVVAPLPRDFAATLKQLERWGA